MTLGDHTAGLEVNKFSETDTSVSGAELFSFSLAPTGESATATQLVINLSDLQGFTSASDFTNLSVYRDTDGDGSISGGETIVFASSPTVSISGGIGTVTFNISSTQSTSTTYYILKGNVSNIGEDYTVGFWMDNSNVSSTGQTSQVGLGRTGGASKVKHARSGGKRRGGGATDGGAATAAKEEAVLEVGVVLRADLVVVRRAVEEMRVVEEQHRNIKRPIIGLFILRNSKH